MEATDIAALAHDTVRKATYEAIAQMALLAIGETY